MSLSPANIMIPSHFHISRISRHPILWAKSMKLFNLFLLFIFPLTTTGPFTSFTSQHPGAYLWFSQPSSSKLIRPSARSLVGATEQKKWKLTFYRRDFSSRSNEFWVVKLSHSLIRRRRRRRKTTIAVGSLPRPPVNSYALLPAQ